MWWTPGENFYETIYGWMKKKEEEPCDIKEVPEGMDGKRFILIMVDRRKEAGSSALVIGSAEVDFESVWP